MNTDILIAILIIATPIIAIIYFFGLSGLFNVLFVGFCINLAIKVFLMPPL